QGDLFTWTSKTDRKIPILKAGRPMIASFSILVISVTRPSAGETRTPASLGTMRLGTRKNRMEKPQRAVSGTAHKKYHGLIVTAAQPLAAASPPRTIVEIAISLNPSRASVIGVANQCVSIYPHSSPTSRI